ncbi:MAG: hypothetical protein HY951_04100 [Bacteroidia bacterium]|nr:hypothetical protein [Bacteroidia bacterium]
MKFSQRIGKAPMKKVLQLEEMDIELKNGLWNSYKINFIDQIETTSKYAGDYDYVTYSKLLWQNHFKLTIDTIPNSFHNTEFFIRERFFKFNWYEVYDFIEFIANIDTDIIPYSNDLFKEYCNNIFEKENSGYRFIGNNIAPITNPTEINEIEEVINKSGEFTALFGVNTHLLNSLDKISNKQNPDYRNSIKESISAVECIAKIISENKNDTLAGALDKIKGKTKIHPALEKGFKQIYGYTSDSDGIRHSLTEEPNCDFEDAKFMLVSCSAFINYLISKANKIGIKFDK